MQRASQLKTAQATGAAKLSRAWRVSKQHRGVYTGGKWQVIPTLPPRLQETLNQEQSSSSSSNDSNDSSDSNELDGLIFSLCDGDVSVVRVRTGELIMTIQGRYDLATKGQVAITGTRASDARANVFTKKEETAFVGEDVHEEIVEFAVKFDGTELVTVSRQLLMRHWVLKVEEEVILLRPESEREIHEQEGEKEGEKEGDAPATRLRATWENVRSWKSQHRTAVTSMAYDPSGTLVATAGSERVVKVWDVPRGYCTHNLKMSASTGKKKRSSLASAGSVSLVQFHPSKLELYACTDDDNALRTYDLMTSKCVSLYQHHMSTPTCLSFSSNGALMVSGGRDKVVNVYDVEKRVLLRTAPVYESVEGVCACSLPLSDVVSNILSGRKSGSGSGSSGSGSGSSGSGSSSSSSSSGEEATYWTTVGDGGTMRVWRFGRRTNGRSGAGTTSFDLVGESRKSTTSPVSWSAMSPWVGDVVVATTTDHNFEFWETRPSKNKNKKRNQKNNKKKSDGGGNSSNNTTVPVLPVSGTTLSSNHCPYSLIRRKQIVGYNDDIIDVRFVPPSINPTTSLSTEIIVATNSSELRIVNLETFGCTFVAGHTDIILGVDVSSDGKYVASVSKDRTLNVYQMGGGKGGQQRCVHVGRGRGHTEIVGAVAFGNRPIGGGGGGRPILLTGSLDRTIKAWDLRGLLVALDNEDERDERDERNESDDREEENKPLDIAVRTSVRGHDMDVNKMAVSPNDKMAASASQDKTIKLWSMETLRDDEDLRLLDTLRGHKRGVWDLSFSPVDRMLASSSGDGTVRLWSLNPESRSCVRTFEGHTASVLRVSFVNAGLQVMSGGADGLVKLWTVRGVGTECVSTFDRHKDKIWAMSARHYQATSSSMGKKKKKGERERERAGGEKDDGAAAVAEEEMTVQTQLVTGGGDSILNVWIDCTVEEDAEEIQAKELMLLKEQELSNLVHLKRYGRAIKLSLELDFPLKLRTILEELLLGEAPKAKVSLRGIDLATREQYRSDGGEKVVRKVMATLSENHLSQCLKYISTWNTNARHALLAQWLLHIVVSAVSNERLLRAIRASTTPTDVLLSGLIAYTDRHSARMDRLVEDSYLLDYTLSSMKMLFEMEEENGEGGGGGGSDTSKMMMMHLVSSSEEDEDEDEEEESGSDDEKSGSEEESDSEEEEVAPLKPIRASRKRSAAVTAAATTATATSGRSKRSRRSTK